MEWYYILAIVLGVIAALFLLTFVVYITNSDMKMVEKLYNKIIAYHDAKHVDEEL